MKKIALGILVSTITVTGYAASVCTSQYGKMQCGTGEIDNINHLGDLTLAGTHVLGELTVVGNVDANNTEIGSGDITGTVDASHLRVDHLLNSTGKFHTSNSIFNGRLKVVGNLDAKNDLFNDKVDIVGNVELNSASFKKEAEFTGILSAKFSHFAAPIRINACESTFNHATTMSLLVSAQKNCWGSNEIVRIQEQSQVKGDIQFASGNGKVYLSKNSLISGRVIGGVVVRE